MNPDTLKALQASIEHWERLVVCDPRTSDEEPFSKDCPLCQRFRADSCKLYPKHKDVEQCPVAIKTGYVGCRSTPWRATAEAFNAFSDKYDETPDEDKIFNWKQTAQAELDFLRSLLPPTTDK